MEELISQWFDRALWFVITGLASFAVQALRQMNKSICDLNNQVAVMIERMTNQERRIDTMEGIILNPGRKP